MGEPFIGSEAIAKGDTSASRLRSSYTKLFRDVYVAKDIELTPLARAQAGWLWSRRQATIAGFTASALHGSKWVDEARPVELIHDNRHRLDNLKVWGNVVADVEIVHIGSMPVTSPERTALDLACWYPMEVAIPAIDALVRATDLKLADVELLAGRYPGRRGIKHARRVLGRVDGGAESPRETWLRLLLMDAGFPRPQTQIPVYDRRGKFIARLDMGWETIHLAVEYDGGHHRTDERQFAWDITRMELLQNEGWIVIRVTARDRPSDIVRRVRTALARRA